MTDLAEGLSVLVARPAAPPPPVEDLRRRVVARARRRARRRAGFAGMAVAAVSLVLLPLVHRPGDRTTIATGPPGVAGATKTTHLEYTLPDGWLRLDADGQELVLATRPLSDRDVMLARLTRADASFSALPPDAVVLAVGLDPLEAKYGTDWDGHNIDPGPAYALGPERVLPDGVRFRRGDVPQSVIRIASYAGVAATPAQQREAEVIAASIRQVGAAAPLPPRTSPTLPPGGLPEVARAGDGASTLVLRAGGDCADARLVDSQSSSSAGLSDGCLGRPSGSSLAAVGAAFAVWGAPGFPPSSAAILRAGPGVQGVVARTADGRSFPAAIGAGGWGMAVVPGRVFDLVAVDGAGQEGAEAFVP